MGDMDSGNSGSMQSSSTGGGGGGGGDDQEYESHGGRGGGGGSNETISAFYNPMPSYNLENMGGVATSPPLQLYSFSNGSSSFAHHNHNHNHNHNHQVVSNYFDHNPTTPLDQCPNFMLNNHHNNNGTTTNNNNNNNNNNDNQLDMMWPNKFARPPPPISTNDANCTSNGPLGYTIANNHQLEQQHQHPAPPRPSSLPQPVASPGTITSNTGSALRNPKKRSRASRKAPTTVLTTDTSNFRQMVQEFTGIPAPPFTGFSTRARFDIFNGLGLGLGSGSGPGPGPGHHNPPSVPTPSYLLRPLPQKMPPLHQPPFSSTVAPEPTSFSLCDSDQTFINTNCLANNSTNLPHHQNQCSANNPANGGYRGISTNTAAAAATNGALDNNGASSATKGEGMVDSWICSSD